jgi:hypothetical protein
VRSGPSDIWRAVAIGTAVAGAIGSSAIVLYVGRRNSSHLLIALFVLWVSSPFGFVAYLSGIAQLWRVRTRTILYLTTIALSLVTLALYGRVVFGPPRPKPASTFLVVPAASWLVLSTGVAIARLRRTPDAR